MTLTSVSMLYIFELCSKNKSNLSEALFDPKLRVLEFLTHIYDNSDGLKNGN